mmetsp:Transcript_34759/g.70998  ORF Transcript_34759/g.70998 Transcript_34759/m.70998 type:complete len:81 (+) Transcript_34759:119-361(+)
MPWQSAPAFGVIFVMMNVAAGGLWTVQRVAYGKDRETEQTNWSFAMSDRDTKVAKWRSMSAEQREAYAKAGRENWGKGTV